MSDRSEGLSVLVADDDPEVRQALGLLCEQALDFRVAGEAVRTEEVLRLTAALHPQIVLLDWSLPGDPPVSAALLNELHQVHPARVVILGARPEAQKDALAIGAEAFICKGDPPDRLLAVLRGLM